MQHLANEFWFRWKREYLTQLQLKQKWAHPLRNLEVDDVVLIKDESRWKLVRVEKAPEDQDGLVRKVELLAGDPQLDDKGRRTHQVAHLERPIHKLVPLHES